MGRYDDQNRAALATNAVMNDPDRAAGIRSERQAFKAKLQDDAQAAQAALDGTFGERAALSREMQGTFDQNAGLKREMQGTFDQNAGLKREIDGSFIQKAAQDEKIKGTFDQTAGLQRELKAADNDAANWRTTYTGGIQLKSSDMQYGPDSILAKRTEAEYGPNGIHSRQLDIMKENADSASYHYVPKREDDGADVYQNGQLLKPKGDDLGWLAKLDDKAQSNPLLHEWIMKMPQEQQVRIFDAAAKNNQTGLLKSLKTFRQNAAAPTTAGPIAAAPGSTTAAPAIPAPQPAPVVNGLRGAVPTQVGYNPMEEQSEHDALLSQIRNTGSLPLAINPRDNRGAAPQFVRRQIPGVNPATVGLLRRPMPLPDES